MAEEIPAPPEAVEEPEHQEQTIRPYINIVEPIALWILLLVIASAIKVMLILVYASSSGMSFYSYALAISNFILSFPGIVIIPAIVGVMIGRQCGIASDDIKEALNTGAVHALYSAAMYMIAMIAIALALDYILPNTITPIVLATYNILVSTVVLVVALMATAVFTYPRGKIPIKPASG